jgi:hypothetical protein
MASERKATTQKAALERVLAQARTRRVRPFVNGKRVLDFGCGNQAWNANQIFQYCERIVGVEPNLSSYQLIGQVPVYPSLAELPESGFDAVLALAVFEHINPFTLIEVLNSLAQYCHAEAYIVGTVPTPLARPILEFLSFRLKLIDPSQIADHKVYYDDLWLQSIVAQSSWQVASYQLFQAGCNSQFVLRRKQ